MRNNIRYYRRLADAGVLELSKETGISAHSLRKYERTTCLSMRVDTLIKIKNGINAIDIKRTTINPKRLYQTVLLSDLIYEG